MYLNKINSSNIYLKSKESTKVSEPNFTGQNTKKSNSKALKYSLTALGIIGAASLLYFTHGKLKASPKIKPSGRTIETIETLERDLETQIPKKPAKFERNLEKLKGLVSEEIPTNNSDYNFLQRNPEGFYLESGKEVNNFLRTGTFSNIHEIPENIPEELKKVLESQIREDKEFNRTIIESIDVLDAQMTSRTSEAMTVYRDVPASWLRTAKDGILHDSGYLSTSTVRGASMEGMISNGAENVTCEIRLKPDMPYWDLTHTAEKEMLLPRGLNFRIVEGNILEVI